MAGALRRFNQFAHNIFSRWLVSECLRRLGNMGSRRPCFAEIGVYHHLPQMFLHRAAMRGRNLAEAVFGIFGDVTDGQSGQNDSPLKSMYAMKAMLSNAQT